MRIVFWENIVSQHKLTYWQSLSASESVSEFVLVVEIPLTTSLKQQGWLIDEGALENIQLIINPKASRIETLIRKEPSSSFHIFSGIRAIPLVFIAFQISLKYEVSRILLTETVNYYALRSITRRLATLWIERKYLRYYDLVLGSGASTQEWYLECGLNKNSFYPFLYSVKPGETTATKSPDKPTKLLFIGQLIKRKGLDILIKALSNLDDEYWLLDIYGTGNQESHLKELVKALSLERHITFRGVVENQQLKAQMSAYHCLVLPSRFDGWGAVVNEAIAAGLKVICSNRCGASILMVNNKIGWVFDIKKPAELTERLEELIQRKVTIDRDYILKYNNYLKGDMVADYLIAIIAHHYFQKGKRPLPLWERFLLENNTGAEADN